MQLHPHDIVSHPREAATRTGDTNPPTTDSHHVEEIAAFTTTFAQPLVEGQRDNLLYTEDLGFLPMWQDPRYVFYRYRKNEKFDVKNKDVLYEFKEFQLLEHLELLQIS